LLNKKRLPKKKSLFLLKKKILEKVKMNSKQYEKKKIAELRREKTIDIQKNCKQIPVSKFKIEKCH